MMAGITNNAIMDPLYHGQSLYRKKDFHGALQCFNSIIANEDSLLYAALNKRAATYTQIGDLQAALRDGKRMIREDKASCMGYLRTGKVLQLLGENQLALRIYKFGLKIISSGSTNIELLRHMHDKLCMHIRTVDPMNVLPGELAELILQHVGFQTVVKLLCVSKSWRSMVISMPRMWRHLDFSGAVKPVSMGAIRSYVKNSNGSTTRATFHFSKPHHDEILRYITQHCKRLEHIDVASGLSGSTLLKAAPFAKTLKTVILSGSCEVTLDTLSQFLGHCSSIERAEFHNILSHSTIVKWPSNMPQIRSLVLSVKRREPVSGSTLNLDMLLLAIPLVKNLAIQGWNWLHRPQPTSLDFSALTQLRQLSLAHSIGLGFPQLPPSISSLDLTDSGSKTGRTIDSMFSMLNCSLPALRSLSLVNFYDLEIAEFSELLRPSQGRIQSLNIRGCHKLDVAGIHRLLRLGFLDGVVKLGLGDSAVNDALAEALATRLHHLKVLDLESSKVTGVGVKALVLKPHAKLEYLNLKNCASVHVDAVEFARSQGVAVQFSFPDLLGKSKRVRQ